MGNAGSFDLKVKAYALWRKLFGRYEVYDPRPTALESPYTFYLPSNARLKLIETGDLVKIGIRGIPKSLVYDVERMWVKVISIYDDNIVGTLSNVPIDIPQLTFEDLIEFKRFHIMDTQWENPEKGRLFPKESSKQIWDRCLVDKEVLNGSARVGFIYREEADLARDDDKYPDSGWRIRADVRDLSDDKYENPEPEYIALGKVLNRDDSWIHLIQEPTGSRFLRNPKTDSFEQTE